MAKIQLMHFGIPFCLININNKRVNKLQNGKIIFKIVINEL